jgi:hypothetical protein
MVRMIHKIKEDMYKQLHDLKESPNRQFNDLVQYTVYRSVELLK